MKSLYYSLAILGSTLSIAVGQPLNDSGPLTAHAALRQPLTLTEESGAIEQPVELLPPGEVKGQKPLTLDDLEAMALANNPTLASAAARIQAARGEWTQAGLPPNPVIGYSGSEIGNEGRAGQQGAFIGQQIVTGGKLRLSRTVAAQEVQAAQSRLETQRLRVLNDVRTSFYDVLLAQRRIEIAQQLVQIGETAVESIEKFIQAGESNRVDLLQARVEANSARVLLENARNDHEAAWRKLAAVIGAPGLSTTPLTGDLQSGIAEITFEGALQRLLASSPELATVQADANRARQAVARARAEPIPNVDLQSGVQYDNATGDTIAGVQVGLPIPLWNRNQGGIQRAEAEFAAARGDIQRTELDLQRRLAAAYQRYANARQQVTTYKELILPDAQASLDLVSAGYRQGEFGYLLLLTSQRTYFQTHLAYLDSLRQLRESSVVIEGLLLTDSLGEPGAPQ